MQTGSKILVEKKIKMPAGSKYPFDSMKVGDSFELGEYSVKASNKVLASAWAYRKRDGNGEKMFSALKTDDGKLRVWRTK